MTYTDRLSRRRHILLIDMIATHLGTHWSFFPLTPMTVYGITGERDCVPATKVTAADRLRCLVREEATHPEVHVATRNALKETVQKANETIEAGVTRLTDAFRA